MESAKFFKETIASGLRQSFEEAIRQLDGWKEALAALAAASSQYVVLSSGPSAEEAGTEDYKRRRKIAALHAMRSAMQTGMYQLCIKDDKIFIGDPQDEERVIRDCGGDNLRESRLLLMDTLLSICRARTQKVPDLLVAKANLYSALYRVNREIKVTEAQLEHARKCRGLK